MTATHPQPCAEIAHFDELVNRTGESWWGHRTVGGQRRLARRASIIRRVIPLGSDIHVLEIGAGAGALTEAVLRERPDAAITAVDISPGSIHRLRTRIERFPNARAEVGDIMQLAFDDGRFDAVIGNSALHHVDVRRCLVELHRVVKPGGRLVVFEPNLLNPEVLLETFAARSLATRRLDYSEDERTFSRWTYRQWLRDSGFQNISVRPFDYLHPITPNWLVGPMALLGRTLECVPLFRELAGSLCLAAIRDSHD